MKSLRIAMILACTMAFVTNSCSTIVDEPEVSDAKIVLPDEQGTTNVLVQEIGNNFVNFSFSKECSGDFAIDGVRLFSFEDNYSLTIKNLQPTTHYNMQIRIKENNLLHAHDFEVDTRATLLELVGAQVMDLDYDETRIEQIAFLSNGDMIERLDNLVRRIDPEGHVKWRLPFANLDRINLNLNDGLIAVCNYHSAYSIDVTSGQILAVCAPKDKEVMVKDACIGLDGSIVLVGDRHYIPGTISNDWIRKYYIGHFDASGNPLNEIQEGRLQENNLITVSPRPTGGYTAIGALGYGDLSIFTFDDDCQLTNTTSYVNPCRESTDQLVFLDPVFDSQGNTYYFGKEDLTEMYYYSNPIIIKYNTSDQIEWIRRLNGGTTYTYPKAIQVVDNHIAALIAHEQYNYSPVMDNVFVLDTEGSLVAAENTGLELNTVNFKAQDASFSEFLLYTQSGAVIRLLTDGFGDEEFLGLAEVNY